MDEEQALSTAKDLIKRQAYQEARRVLKPIAYHPAAQKWLAKLDEIAPAQTESLWANSSFGSQTSTTRPYSDTHAWMSDSEKLAQAKALIKQQSYDEARQILVTLPNDPTAQKWLAKLDEIAPVLFAPQADSFARSSSSSPFDSLSSGSSSLGYEIIPTKPKDSYTPPSYTTGSIPTTGKKGKQAKQSKPAKSKASSGGCVLGSIGNRIMIRLFLVVVVLAASWIFAQFGVDIGGFFGPGGKFENDTIKLRYSGDWDSVSLTSRQSCRDAVGTCLLYLEHRQAAIALMFEDLPLAGRDETTIINLLWDGYVQANTGMQQVGGVNHIDVDGRNATQWYIAWHSDLGRDMYGMVMYIPTGRSVIELAVWGNSQTIFANNFEDVQKIIDSIEIK